MSGKFHVSFDVERLFINIPREECINVAVKYIYEGNPDLERHLTDLKRLFSMPLQNLLFCLKFLFMTKID